MFYLVDASRYNVSAVIEASDIDELHDIIVAKFPFLKVASVTGQDLCEVNALKHFSLSVSSFNGTDHVNVNGKDFYYLPKTLQQNLSHTPVTQNSAPGVNPNTPSGATCIKCNNYSPYANSVPNFVCYSCRN